MTRPVKLAVWGAACALVPFAAFVGATSYQVTNGVLTDYSYLNIAAIVGGIAAACLGVALLSRGPNAMAESARPGWAVPVCVVLVLLGAFQVVRGLGVLPGITDCVSESGSAGFCAEVPAPDHLMP